MVKIRVKMTLSIIPQKKSFYLVLPVFVIRPEKKIVRITLN